MGWTTWEEIDRVPNPPAGVENFGWPCYEGAAEAGRLRQREHRLCEGLYATARRPAPFFAYRHSDHVFGEGGAHRQLVISGLAFTPPGGT